MTTTSSAATELHPTDQAIFDAGITRMVPIPAEARGLRLLETSEARPVQDDGTVWPVVAPIRLPASRQAQPRFDALQKWEGRVLEVGDSTFAAVVVDAVEAGVEEEAEFDLEEVSPGDLDLVEPGAIFYWSIGYRTEPSGERSRSSVLVFRRLPAWSAKDLSMARSRADHIRDRLGW